MVVFKPVILSEAGSVFPHDATIAVSLTRIAAHKELFVVAPYVGLSFRATQSFALDRCVLSTQEAIVLTVKKVAIAFIIERSM